MTEYDDSTGEYMLAKQIGNRAFFARVVVVVSPPTEQIDLVISIDSDVDLRWHSAVSFGIEYAWEQLAQEMPHTTPVSVRVISVEWQPSDSTKLTVAFAAANALWEALKRRPERMPQLDVSSGLFSFPN